MKFRFFGNLIIKTIPSRKREIYALTFLNSLGYGETSIDSEVSAVINSIKLTGTDQ